MILQTKQKKEWNKNSRKTLSLHLYCTRKNEDKKNFRIIIKTPLTCTHAQRLKKKL
jgi:hypothetical protein